VYEYVDGSEFRPEWRGRKIPVPPQEVRERIRLPKKYQLYTLHQDVKEEYPEVFYSAAVDYVKNFASYAKQGVGPVFAGSVRSGTSRIAAATMNQLVTRFVGQSDVTATWLSGFWVLRMIMDARHFNRSDQYTTLRSQVLTSSIVVVDDLIAGSEIEGGRNFIETVYAYRDDHCLPTITTIPLPDAKADVGRVIEKAYGKKFRERLSLSAKGLFARV
jgi:DNA replication protein DnaC